MEDYEKNRPKKIIYKKNNIHKLRDKAIRKIKTKFLPDSEIIKIILIGSSIKSSFGRYYPPGFRGSLFSDFDFIFIVKNHYQIPKWLKKEPRGKPFPDKNLNLAYRNKNFIDNKYDVEMFFIKESSMQNAKIKSLAEKAGIPLKQNSKNKHMTIYEK